MPASTEEARLQDLHAYGILDTPQEAAFDELVELASIIADTPISLLSLVDRDRQWFKSIKGLDATETPRQVSFCTHTIMQDGPMVVEDATSDSRFQKNEYVTSNPHIRFYAGFPLVSHSGYKIGTLCVVDQQPRKLSDRQLRKLELIARQAERLLELHRTNRALAAVQQQQQKQQQVLETLLQNQHKLMTILAHDNRGPLSSLKHLLSFLTDPEMNTEERNNLVAMIASQLNGMEQLYDSLVQWGKVSMLAGGSENEHQCQNVNAVITEVLEQHRVAAAIKRNELVQTTIPGTGVAVSREGIAFVIRNLVSNAIKFTSDGKVQVGGYADKSVYRITVTDTGTGMDQNRASTLFRNKVNPGQGTLQECGSGMGLMLVGDFLCKCGGTIAVDSKKGEGTTITVALPLATKNDRL